MLLPCKYAVIHTVNTLCFFLWDLQATVFRTSYLIKKEKTVCWLLSLHLGGREVRAGAPKRFSKEFCIIFKKRGEEQNSKSDVGGKH